MASALRSVDPSVSRTPLPVDASDLPTVCVLCSHNCGLRVDVEGGRITEVRADESNPITRGYVCNKGFQVAPAELEVDASLDTWGGVEVAGADGRRVRNTLEERLARADAELRLTAARLIPEPA